jgi:hypothetical protein
MHGVGGSPGAEDALAGGHRHRPEIADLSMDSLIADLLARVEQRFVRCGRDQDISRQLR